MTARKATGLQAELKQKRKFQSKAQEATVALLRTADLMRSHMTSVIAPYGVTMQQYNVLRILRGSHPQPLPTLEIGERLIERMPGVTRLLDRLEEKKLVRRVRASEDRRQVNCWITPQGLKLLAAMDEPVLHADEELVKHLSGKELASLIELLDRIRSLRR